MCLFLRDVLEHLQIAGVAEQEAHFFRPPADGLRIAAEMQRPYCGAIEQQSDSGLARDQGVQSGNLEGNSRLSEAVA